MMLCMKVTTSVLQTLTNVCWVLMDVSIQNVSTVLGVILVHV